MAGPGVGCLRTGYPGETKSAGYTRRRSGRCGRGRGFDSRRLQLLGLIEPFVVLMREERFRARSRNLLPCLASRHPSHAQIARVVMAVDTRSGRDVGMAKSLRRGID